MPENNPLHLEMRVREYLKFRARLKGIGRARVRERVDTVMEQ
jgi:ABC-2 type transport system ATP-binding protein